jgi:ribosomal protein S20
MLGKIFCTWGYGLTLQGKLWRLEMYLCGKVSDKCYNSDEIVKCAKKGLLLLFRREVTEKLRENTIRNFIKSYSEEYQQGMQKNLSYLNAVVQICMHHALKQSSLTTCSRLLLY